MGVKEWLLVGAVLVGAAGGGQAWQPEDRLYGRVTTAGGRVYEGYLRWDGNEGSWVDLLDGDRDLPWENLRDAERLEESPERRRRERSIDIFGLRISWTEGKKDLPSTSASGVRFGHVLRVAVTGDDRALITLRSGEEVELFGGSTDLGDDLRMLVVEDAGAGTVELRWMDLDVVELFDAPAGAPPPVGTRLHGTVHTRSGQGFTGFVGWDMDEILDTDRLDGEEEGVEVSFPFSSIHRIERAGSRGARVTLVDGEEILLRGSNDVDEGNRGVAVSDPQLGQVVIEWSAFETLVLHPPEGEAGTYASFDGGTALHGTVETELGEIIEGWIRWDNDEASTWEILDGHEGGVSYDIEFGRIRGIRKLGSRGAEVTLRDGRVFRLGDSNDVDGGNRGIYVTPEDGETVLVPWWDFRAATFSGS